MLRIGTFFEGEKHGIGHFQDSQGRVFEETWVYGTLKSRTLLSRGPGGENGNSGEMNNGKFIYYTMFFLTPYK